MNLFQQVAGSVIGTVYFRCALMFWHFLGDLLHRVKFTVQRHLYL